MTIVNAVMGAKGRGLGLVLMYGLGGCNNHNHYNKQGGLLFIDKCDMLHDCKMMSAGRILSSISSAGRCGELPPDEPTSLSVRMYVRI